MIALKKRFKQKITIVGGKGKTTQKKAEGEEAKKREEDARRLAQEAESWLNNEDEEKNKYCGGIQEDYDENERILY